jgi:predicted ferric reductase
MYKKIIFFLILIGIFCLVPITVLHNVDLSVALKYHATTTDFLQRLLGLAIFVLLFWQIMIGKYMDKLKKWLGVWIYNFHIWEGIFIYVLVFLHPLMFLLFRHFSGAGTDPVFVYLGFCGYCQTKIDYYYTLGRFAFWLLTIGVFAGLFRASTLFLKKNWKNFRVINYIVFLLAGIHGFLTGTDFSTKPFFYFAILAYLIVIYIIFRKAPNLLSTYNKWLNS